MLNLLGNDLETRKRAIANWKRIRILLVLFKMCGGKHHEFEHDAHEEKVIPEKHLSCRERIAPYII